MEEQYRLEEIVPRLLHDFKHAVVKVRLKEKLRELQQPEVAQNSERYTQILKECMELTQIERLFATVLGDRVILK